MKLKSEVLDQALPVAENLNSECTDEKQLLRKVDLHLVPILFLLLLCTFLDRINIGNARLQGLEADLNMTGSDYNIALFAFFPLYILLEVPSNMLLKKTRPATLLCSLLASCGLVTIGQGLTQSFGGLVVCRVLLGALEAGIFPGCIYLLSMYYRRHELQWRFNLFFTASTLAGAVSGFLAYAIAHMSGLAGYGGWRWIFIIEGIATVFVAMGAFWVIPDWPESARFLNQVDRTLLETRLRVDHGSVEMDHWDKKAAKRVFGDAKIYLGILMYIGIVTTTYSTSFFVPTILRQLGWTALRAQVMSIPVYVSAMVCSLTIAWTSDKLKHRYTFLLLGCFTASIGYIILLNMFRVHVGVRYFAVYTLVAGGTIAQTLSIVWVSNTMAGHYKRGVSSAMMVGFGNIGGIIASNIYITSQAPQYHVGFGVGFGFLGLCMASATALLFYLRRENRLRDQGKRDHRLDLADDEKQNLGDHHPSFRFTY